MNMVSIINKYLSDGRDFTFAWAMFLDGFYVAESEKNLRWFANRLIDYL